MRNRWEMALWLVLLMAGSALAQTAVERISADVVILDGPMLQIKTRSGEMAIVRLSEKARVQTRARVDAGVLAAGLFVGVTAVPQPDGTLLASQVSIFPETLRGTGEGHRPLDTVPGSTMTNATITALPADSASGAARNTMTNATVAQVASGDRVRRLTLTYAGGEKTVVVPDSIPVILSEIGDRSMLVPDVHVVVDVTRQPDGSLAADRISVGKNGMVPTS